jgi:uncharacterized membrane protein YcaP (DUF421 family)
MNAFDLVVTVALGSTLATIILTRDVALTDGLAALLVLVLLQYAIAVLSVRWNWIERLAKSDARLLVVDGVVDPQTLKLERVTHEEILCAVRCAGFGDLADVAAVVLETNGSLSVVSRERVGSGSALPPRREASA